MFSCWLPWRSRRRLEPSIEWVLVKEILEGQLPPAAEDEEDPTGSLKRWIDETATPGDLWELIAESLLLQHFQRAPGMSARNTAPTVRPYCLGPG